MDVEDMPVGGARRMWTAHDQRVRAAPLPFSDPEASPDDPALFPTGDDRYLGAADPFQDLVRDRGPCLRRPGGTRRDPEGKREAIWEKGGNATFDVDRIDEIERVTKHDVIAFLTHLAEFIGPESRFVHQGMTSSDVLDTCLSVQLTRAADLLIADVDDLLAAIKAPGLGTQTSRRPSAAAMASTPSR